MLGHAHDGGDVASIRKSTKEPRRFKTSRRTALIRANTGLGNVFLQRLYHVKMCIFLRHEAAALLSILNI